MKNKNNSQKLSFSLAVFKGSFIHNPVLTQVLGVCPIVAAATTLKNAVNSRSNFCRFSQIDAIEVRF